MPYRRFLLTLLVLLLSIPARGEDPQQSFNIEQERLEKGNLLNMIFGSAPAMPTERGILIIDAFNDRNGNGRRDADEKDIAEDVVCRLDDTSYTVPAFIPGLASEGSYAIACSGDRYRPTLKQNSIFIRQRGEIIQLDLPCAALTPADL